MNVLGLDPGFASFGWAHMRLDPGCTRPWSCVDAGIIRTKPAPKRERLTKAEDARMRSTDIAEELGEIVARTKPLVICAEQFSPLRNASSSAKLARAWGVIDGIAYQHRIPVVCVQPMRLKKMLTGKTSASKGVVKRCVQHRLGLVVDTLPWEARYPEGQHEHAWDAMAAAIACEREERLLLIQRAREARAG